MIQSYLPIRISNHTARFAKYQPCRGCGEKRTISYLTDGMCASCRKKAAKLLILVARIWGRPDELYKKLDRLAEHRRQFGKGRNEGAQYVRDFCKAQREKVKAELKALGFPATRSGDTRVYGPGQANWQRAGGR